MIRNYKYGFTHGGAMHADDVFAAAILKLIDDKFEIIRQRHREDELPLDDNVLIFDIGLGCFDHHQKDAKLRPSGKKYASVGLIFAEFWKDMGLTEEEYTYLDKTLIEKIDYSDNYGDLCDYSTMIDYFNLSWIILKNKSDDAIFNLENKCFEKAIEFAQEIILNELNFYRNKSSNNEITTIEKLYCECFMDLVVEKYKGESRLIDIVKKFGINLLNKECISYFINKMTRLQNVFDNHNFKAGFVRIINNYDLNSDIGRRKAFNIIKFILEKEVVRAYHEYLAEDYILGVYRRSNNNYLVFDLKKVPWIRTVTTLNEQSDRKIDFIIYLNENGTCGVQCVPNSFYLKNTQRIPFNKEIRGASLEDLTNYLDGLTFCHSSGFYSVTKNLETAIKLIQKTCC